MDRQEHPLLSKGACERLKLLSFQVDSVSEYRAKYRAMFEGLGELRDYPYTIKLRDDESPVTVTVPRRVPYPLLPKVKTDLYRMVAQGVISKVERTTDWCSGLVVVPKANKTDVRLCVDITQLNKVVKREFHPMSCSSSLGAVSNSDVGGHGFPLFPVYCSFDDLDFTDFQQLARLFMKFSRGLPLLLSPSIFQVTTMFSSPCFLMICPRKLICPALILFINFLSACDRFTQSVMGYTYS